MPGPEVALVLNEGDRATGGLQRRVNAGDMLQFHASKRGINKADTKYEHFFAFLLRVMFCLKLLETQGLQQFLPVRLHSKDLW